MNGELADQSSNIVQRINYSAIEGYPPHPNQEYTNQTLRLNIITDDDDDKASDPMGYEEERQKMQERKFVNKKDFVIFEVVIQCAKNRLCNIHKATLKGQEVLCKVIELDRVTNYMIESFLTQLV